MRRALLRNASLYTHHLLRPSPSPFPSLPLSPPIATNPKIIQAALPFSCSLLSSRFCSSDNESSSVTVTEPKLDIEATEETQKQVDFEVKDVNNKEFVTVLNKFLEEYSPYDSDDFGSDGSGEDESEDDEQEEGGEEQSSLEEEEDDDDDVEESANDDVRGRLVDAVISRVIAGKHDETDDDVIDALHAMKIKADFDIKKPKSNSVKDVEDEDFDEDKMFDEHMDELDTDGEIDDLYDVRSIVEKRIKENYVNVDDKKWDDLIKEHTGEGYSEVMSECVDILEDMQDFNKLLPDDIKKKVQEKFEELGTRCEREELKPEEAYELFSKFEEEIINEHMDKTEAEGPPLPHKTVVPYKTYEPAGEGPILRWQTRVVFSPGDKAWHPKNRKVKLSVTVKELGLTKHQFRRLRAVVGKRYHPGRDELTIISERFEHREENRKDCLRTLLALIEDAGKAEQLVQDARASYVKERLKANPAFMERLNAKIMRLQGRSNVPVLTSA